MLLAISGAFDVTSPSKFEVQTNETSDLIFGSELLTKITTGSKFEFERLHVSMMNRLSYPE